LHFYLGHFPNAFSLQKCIFAALFNTFTVFKFCRFSHIIAERGEKRSSVCTWRPIWYV